MADKGNPASVSDLTNWLFDVVQAEPKFGCSLTLAVVVATFMDGVIAVIVYWHSLYDWYFPYAVLSSIEIGLWLLVTLVCALRAVRKHGSRRCCPIEPHLIWRVPVALVVCQGAVSFFAYDFFVWLNGERFTRLLAAALASYFGASIVLMTGVRIRTLAILAVIIMVLAICWTLTGTT